MTIEVLGVGNPLLDVIADVNREFLAKYDLGSNTAILAEQKHIELFKEVESYPSATFVAGGATLNSIRVCQGLLGNDHLTAYSGCIGDDKNGKEMRKQIEKEGVEDHFCISKKKNPTGTCAVLVTNMERSLVTSLGAANDYDIDFINKDLEKTIIDSRVIYSSGYFITVCPDGMKKVAKIQSDNNKLYILNIAAPFIALFFFDHVKELLPYVDYLFGNDDEFKALGEKLGFGDNLENIAIKLAKYEKNNQRKRIVIITRAADPVIIAGSKEMLDFHEKGQEKKENEEEKNENKEEKNENKEKNENDFCIKKLDVPHIDHSKIIDTNGAGDAFVGGFLYGIIKKKPINYSVKIANFAGAHVIQKSGCTFHFDGLPSDLQ